MPTVLQRSWLFAVEGSSSTSCQHILAAGEELKRLLLLNEIVPVDGGTDATPQNVEDVDPLPEREWIGRVDPSGAAWASAAA